MDQISPAALRKISRELHALDSDPPEGIKVIANDDTITDIHAWILGPEGTPYDGGCFRLRIQLSPDFPNAPPKCYFMTKIFHPNVSKQGDVCVSTLKKDWKPDLGLRHILLVVKCLLIVPNPESALNEEAGRQLLEKYDDYAKHARLMTEIHAISQRHDIFPIKETTEASPSFSEATTSPLHSVLESSTGQKRKPEDNGDTRPQKMSEKVPQGNSISQLSTTPNNFKTHLDPTTKDPRTSSAIAGLDKRIDRATSVNVMHTRETRTHPQFIQKQDKKHGLRRL
ncbi:ubiquitin-conjugating enzyme E2 S [Podila verticillata NRRL 6337]|nr:ubiquitin-conjugating enzyme E2 S [Podila verticillata NRRL 6337]